jgi:hypothetical protein
MTEDNILRWPRLFSAGGRTQKKKKKATLFRESLFFIFNFALKDYQLSDISSSS